MALNDLTYFSEYPGRVVGIGMINNYPTIAYLLTVRSTKNRKIVPVESEITKLKLGFIPGTKVDNPDLHEYTCMALSNKKELAVASNGKQTDPIMHEMDMYNTCSTEAIEILLEPRFGYEPDALGTPRIAGILDLVDELACFGIIRPEKEKPTINYADGGPARLGVKLIVFDEFKEKQMFFISTYNAKIADKNPPHTLVEGGEVKDTRLIGNLSEFNEFAEPGTPQLTRLDDIIGKNPLSIAKSIHKRIHPDVFVTCAVAQFKPESGFSYAIIPR